MGTRFLLLQRLRRAPLSLLLHRSFPIQTSPSLPFPPLFSPFDPYPLRSFSQSLFWVRFLTLPCYESSVRVDPCQNSRASRSLSYGSANLVPANGKPGSETHEIGPPRKKEEEEKFPNANGRSNYKVEKVCDQRPASKLLTGVAPFCINCSRSIHTTQPLSNTEMEAQSNPEMAVSVDDHGDTKVKRKKLKGKRAVVRWLKFFRWKKKKEYERMTAEEKILYKLKKARKKEERLGEKLKKIEPSDSSETTHDPEILTPEEHFYFLKMGQKCKNYVPVGRRGIFQGVILNMHLHWKKHQTLKVVVKTFTLEEVREIAAELARLSGGIVLDIQEDRTIIMYRGKNYAQPPTEIMSPKVTLSRKKALDKSKYRDSLHAVRRYIPRLQQDLEDLQAKMKRGGENKAKTIIKEESPAPDEHKIISDHHLEDFEALEEQEFKNELQENDSQMDSSTWSESEDLSDIFETDSDEEIEEKLEQPLYLDEVDKFPSQKDEEPENFEEHLREIASASRRSDSSGKDVELLAELDEIDKIFLRAGSLLKKKRR